MKSFIIECLKLELNNSIFIARISYSLIMTTECLTLIGTVSQDRNVPGISGAYYVEIVRQTS